MHQRVADGRSEQTQFHGRKRSVENFSSKRNIFRRVWGGGQITAHGSTGGVGCRTGSQIQITLTAIKSFKLSSTYADMTTLPQLIEEDVQCLDGALRELLEKSDATTALVIDKGGFLISDQGDSRQF